MTQIIVEHHYPTKANSSGYHWALCVTYQGWVSSVWDSLGMSKWCVRFVKDEWAVCDLSGMNEWAVCNLSGMNEWCARLARDEWVVCETSQGSDEQAGCDSLGMHGPRKQACSSPHVITNFHLIHLTFSRALCPPIHSNVSTFLHPTFRFQPGLGSLYSTMWRCSLKWTTFCCLQKT